MEPTVTSTDEIQRRSGFQTPQPPQPPSWAGVDQDWSRRPGRLHVASPQPLPNTRFPPQRQRGTPAAPMHRRPNKNPPPVFGTSTPLRGLSGAVRRLAYSMPDHKPSHWLLLMLGDRVESWSYRLKKASPLLLPAAVWFGARTLRRERLSR